MYIQPSYVFSLFVLFFSEHAEDIRKTTAIMLVTHNVTHLSHRVVSEHTVNIGGTEIATPLAKSFEVADHSLACCVSFEAITGGKGNQ